jgi:hypothetical protein
MVPFRLLAPAAAAAVTITALLVAPRAQALPAPGTHQVTGNQLATTLLPASAFGHGSRTFRTASSGSHLEHGPALSHVARMSCRSFWGLFDAAGYGETAFAIRQVVGNTKAYDQAIFQFAKRQSAAALFGQEAAKFAACRSFVVDPASSLRVSLRRMVKTQVSGYRAFLVVWAQTDSNRGPVPAVYTLVTIDGADLFIVHATDFAGAMPANPSPSAVTLKLLERVSALR